MAPVVSLRVTVQFHVLGWLPLSLYSTLGSRVIEVLELTTALLFDGEDEMSIMGQHVAHDGWPPKLAALAARPELEDLTVVLAACLRRDPRNRPNVTATRQALQSCRSRLEAASWPLTATAAAATG